MFAFGGSFLDARRLSNIDCKLGLGPTGKLYQQGTMDKEEVKQREGADGGRGIKVTNLVWSTLRVVGA